MGTPSYQHDTLAGHRPKLVTRANTVLHTWRSRPSTQHVNHSLTTPTKQHKCQSVAEGFFTGWPLWPSGFSLYYTALPTHSWN